MKRDEHMILGNARFTVITENLIRCEYAENGAFYDGETLFAVHRAHNGCDFSVKTDEDSIEITTSAIHLVYWKTDGGFSAENLYGEIFGAEWHFGKKNERNLGGTLVTLDGVDGPRPTDDGLLSREGWFVIDDSDAPPMCDGWLMHGAARRETDIYLFGYGSDYKKALKTLFYVSGKAALPRKCVFGSWYSRWWAYTDEEILGIVDEYDQNDFPLDIMVIDMDWHHHDWTYRGTEECKKHRALSGYGHATNFGWTGYSWNKRLIPDPPSMLKKLHEKGITVTLNDHPHDGVRTHEDAYADFMRGMGLPADVGLDLEFDASDERYMTSFFANVHDKLEADGVDFWWLDWQQDHLKPFVKGTKMRHLPWLNRLYYGQAEKGGKRGLSFSRWGGFGDHKHPIFFSGDTKSTWECLAFEVAFTARSSNVGLFYWGHDTGGFFGEPNPEMYVRWTQFSAFSACLRAHSERKAILDRRPWLWGEKESAAMRKSYHLRARLLPYIYSLAYRAYEEGIPMIEPMYYEYPMDEDAYRLDGQYFFGDAFLVAPITSPMENGAAKKAVWIKEGVWFDLFTGKRYEHGLHEFSCPLDEFPVLVRGGVPIPMQPYTSRMTRESPETLIVMCFPGDGGAFTLYEDDGVTCDFETGAYLKTKISYRKEHDAIAVEIEPFGNGFAGMPTERAYRIELPQTERPLVLAEGEGEINFADGTNVVILKKRATFDPVKIVLR